MQGKKIIIVFAIILGLLCLYNLSFTWYVNNIDCDAIVRSDGDPVKEKKIIEELSKDTLNLGLVKYNYVDAKKRELGLGLDLMGGMNVILQISVKDILEDMADGGKDPFFQEVISATDQLQKNSSEPYIDDFFKEYKRLKKEKGVDVTLSSSKMFGNQKNAQRFNITTDDAKVEKIIKEEVESKIATANQIIRQRIDRFGVSQPNVQRIENSGKILVELPGIKDAERVSALLQSTAQLEFWQVLRPDDQLMAYFTQILGKNGTDSTRNPMTRLMGSPQGNLSFLLQDTAAVNKALLNPANFNKRPEYLRKAKFLWGSKPIETQDKKDEYLELYVVRGQANGQALMSGDIVNNASAERMTGISTQPYVSLSMSGEAALEWANITDKFKAVNQSNPGSPIAIVLDDLVYSAPVAREKIEGGSSQISGDFTMEEATDLANILSAGSLPASADIIQSDVVGPTLGQEAIDAGLMSFLIALGVVLLWMILYYARAGAYADIALLVNLLYLFGILVTPSLGAVLTLPGIAGIILTMGMAVDANVIIYERVKEELRLGKTERQAVEEGYKNAMSSIIDGNITTLITAVVLYFMGEGPVKGFAVTLMIGICTSLFTSIFLSRYFIEARLDNKKSVSFYTKYTKNLFENLHYDFLKNRKVTYAISTILIIISIISISTKGLDLGIDFVGGRNYVVRFDKVVNSNTIGSLLAKDLDNPQVKTFGEGDQVKITTKYKIDDSDPGIENEVNEILYKDLKSYLPANLSFKQFSEPAEGSTVGIMSVSKVGPSVADDITRKAFIAIFISLLAVFFYILLRFRKWEFSLSALIALAHDVIITMGAFSLFAKVLPFSLEIDQAFIAAILTVIGYSLNDTVIIFDRIRENIKSKKILSLYDKINAAINSTLTRTLNTSLTTLFVIIAIFIFGGETIRGFMFALLIGIGIGTYSSIFIASPVFYDLTERGKKDNKEKKLST